MKKIYILPNLFTTANLFTGVLAIINIINLNYETASLLIFISFILDGMDGKIARLTKSQSSFGLNLDSLSDLVAFGVAPAVLIYSWFKLKGPWSGSGARIAAGVAVLFVICGALRLARFNVNVIRSEKKIFIGLPIPAAAGTVVSTFLAFYKSPFFSDMQGTWVMRLLPLVFAGVATLMVSNIPYLSMKNIDLEGRKPFDYLVILIVVVCLAIAFWNFRSFMLLAGFWAYTLSGVSWKTYRIINKIKTTKRERHN